MGEPLPPVTMPKKAVDREVYLAVAATSSPETGVLAGIVRHLLLLRPNMGTPGLKQASEAIAASIAGHRPDPARDLLEWSVGVAGSYGSIRSITLQNEIPQPVNVPAHQGRLQMVRRMVAILHPNAVDASGEPRTAQQPRSQASRASNAAFLHRQSGRSGSSAALLAQ